MKLSRMITWAMLKGMVMKGSAALRRMDEHSLDAMGSNEALLMQLLRDNSNTEYGRKYGFADIHSIREFQERVPFSTYDDYARYIERMVKNGEKNLITAYPVIQYAETSGSIGVQKRIPLTDRAMDVYQSYSGIRMFALAQRHYRENLHKKLPVGRGLNAMEVESTTMEDGTPRGSVSGSAIKKFKSVMPYFLTSPIPVIFPTGGMNMQYMRIRFALEDRDMSYMVSSFMTNISDMLNFMKNNWEMLVEDIANGTVNPEMVKGEEYLEPIRPYLKKMPERANELRKVFEEGFDTPIVPRLWPNLSYVSAIGTGGFAIYADKVRQFIGDIPIDYSVYAASEGIFASASAMNDPKYDLLTDSCFFEFLPTDGSGDEAHPLTLDQLEVGKEYEIIITNLSGFYRYRIKDVIRVLDHHNTTPQITFAYRISQMVNLAAEKTTEEHLSNAVQEFSKAVGCQIDDYCLHIDYDVDPARYVLLVEPDRPLSADLLRGYDMFAVSGGDYHFFIADASGDSRVVEYDCHSETRELVDTPVRTATNFYHLYIDKVLPNQNNGIYGHGRERYDAIEAILTAAEGRESKETAWEALKEAKQLPKPDSITSNTQWSVVYDNTKLTADIVIRRNWGDITTYSLSGNTILAKP